MNWTHSVLIGSALAVTAWATPAQATPVAVTSVARTVSSASTQSQIQNPNQACTDNVGVTVVVDFGDLGGGVNVRCAPGPVSSGLDAMTRAGVAYRTTLRFSGFVCRIAGQPASDPCQTTSPVNAYWSYWIASRGGSWCYSNLGAGSRTPPPGSIEGWSFALNRSGASTPPPRFPVPPVIAGTTPNPVLASHCTEPAELPAQPAPPPPAAPAPGPAPPPAGPDGTAPASPGHNDSLDPGAPGSPRTADGPDETPTSSSSSSVPSSTTKPGSETDAKDAEQSASASSSGGDTPDGSSGPLGSVDLSDDHTSKGSPIALALGVTVIGAIVVGAWSRTRRKGSAGGQGG